MQDHLNVLKSSTAAAAAATVGSAEVAVVLRKKTPPQQYLEKLISQKSMPNTKQKLITAFNNNNNNIQLESSTSTARKRLIIISQVKTQPVDEINNSLCNIVNELDNSITSSNNNTNSNNLFHHIEHQIQQQQLPSYLNNPDSSLSNFTENVSDNTFLDGPLLQIPSGSIIIDNKSSLSTSSVETTIVIDVYLLANCCYQQLLAKSADTTSFGLIDLSNSSQTTANINNNVANNNSDDKSTYTFELLERWNISMITSKKFVQLFLFLLIFCLFFSYHEFIVLYNILSNFFFFINKRIISGLLLSFRITRLIFIRFILTQLRI